MEIRKNKDINTDYGVNICKVDWIIPYIFRVRVLSSIYIEPKVNFFFLSLSLSAAAPLRFVPLTHKEH